jgi:ferrous iron transport protein B
MYFVGIIIIFVGALLIKLLTGLKKKKSFFIIELPEYKAPSLKRAFGSMCQRGWSYIVKAGTIILVCNFVIHLMQNFGWNFAPVDAASDSILATVAMPFAYLFAPIVGIVSWQLAAAAITGFIAKENVVGTLAVCYSISNMFDLDELAMIEGNEGAIAATFGIGTVAALAYLMFNLFSPPCFAAIGAMNSELKSKKWLFAGIGLQLAVGYSVGFLVNFFGTVFMGKKFDFLWMPIVGWCIVLAIAAIITYLVIKRRNSMKKEYKLDSNKKTKVSSSV